jgi:hypothetical protein
LFSRYNGNDIRLRLLKLKSKNTVLRMRFEEWLKCILIMANYIIGVIQKSPLTVQNRTKQLYSSLKFINFYSSDFGLFLKLCGFGRSEFNNSPPTPVRI